MPKLAVISVTAGAADAAWLLLGAFWGFTVLAVLLGVLALSARPASAKSYNTASRVDGVLSAVGSLNSSVTSLAGRIGALEAGTFVNVNGSTVQITGSGGGNLYITALSGWTDRPQVDYLGTLHKQSTPSAVSGAPSSYTTSWGNSVVGALNSLRATLGSGGFNAWP